ncbi:MAG: protein kinase [Deltaproteobacteria bacterium]|nr:protein kinase [Deltaproteobacteria bacterium]
MGSSKIERFGPYVILDRIGDGGMAEIFLAKRQGYSGFEKLIALKKILPRYSANPTFAQMLIQEAKLAASLQHHNVVQVYDLGEIEGQVYIAMEYVHGRDLAAVLSHTYRRKERLPVALSLCIATEFITGLDYAHRTRGPDGTPLRIIHRDISPQNILVSYEGEVKVTDFGIARALGGEGYHLPGNLYGKFGYMSPEQVGGQPIDQRSDIFSAGVVLYEILTGQRLFRGKNPNETAVMISRHPIPPPSALNPEVPPSVDAVCEKALARDRDTRYRTMGTLLGDLSRVADALPRRAATRDLSVYMRRQFGNAADMFGLASRTRSDSGTSLPSYSSSLALDAAPASGDAAGIPKTRTPLGQILVAQNATTVGDVEIALAEQRARGGRIGEILVASGAISEMDLVRALSTQAGVPIVHEISLRDSPVPTELLKRFPREAAESSLILPISINELEHSVNLAVTDPYDDRSILESKIVLGVNHVRVHLAARSVIRRMIGTWYRDHEIEISVEEPIFTAEPASAIAIETVPLILVADSDEAEAKNLGDRLKAEDCEVIVVHEGRSAREISTTRRPAVVLLEASLPVIDGYNILLEIRARSEDAAVFITSSRGDEFRQAKALELGADDFISKPYALELVTSKVRREIKKRAGRFGGAPGGAPGIAQGSEFRGVSGSLTDMTALEIVQSLELARKSAHVILQYEDGRSGEVDVLDGAVRGAQIGTVRGEDAFFTLTRPGSGLFRIEYRKTSGPFSIDRPNTFLMIEAFQQIDALNSRAPREPGKEVPVATSTNPTSPSLGLGLQPRKTSLTLTPASSPAPRTIASASASASESASESAPDGDRKILNLATLASDLALEPPREVKHPTHPTLPALPSVSARPSKPSAGAYSITSDAQTLGRVPIRRIEAPRKSETTDGIEPDLDANAKPTDS